MSASQEPKEGSGKQSNLSWVAWPVSHWAITHIQFGSLSTIVMLSYRKANTQSLEEACSVFHPETQEFIEHVVPVKVSDFRFIPLSTILLGFFFFFLKPEWLRRESEKSSLHSGIKHFLVSLDQTGDFSGKMSGLWVRPLGYHPNLFTWLLSALGCPNSAVTQLFAFPQRQHTPPHSRTWIPSLSPSRPSSSHNFWE